MSRIFSKVKLGKVLITAFFIFFFLLNFSSANIPCEWTGVKKIVAIGDLHGDYENFLKILKGTGIISAGCTWTGGKTHLVQTGDVLDRGPDAKKIFDLIMRLEKEAEEAGGKVHMLIGNHEEMNITGIAFSQREYVTPEQFVSFLPDNVRAKFENRIKKNTEAPARKEEGDKGFLSMPLRESWQELIDTDKQAQAEYTRFFNEKYGDWILSHNAVIKINDIVFVHGGISEKYSKSKLKEINDLLRLQLNLVRKGRMPDAPVIVYDGEGPLWYRDLAQKDEAVLAEEVDRILHNLGVNHMVIAHTPRRGSQGSSEEMNRFNGKIWIIDTGISAYYGGNLSALVIEKGDFSVWRPSHED